MSETTSRNWRHSRSLTGHRGAVSSLSITPDERLVASASLEGSVRIWDRKSGECLRTLDSFPDYQRVFFLDSGAVIASASSQECNLWSVPSGTLLKSFQAERLSIAAGPAVLALGTELGEVTLVDVRSLRVLGSVGVHDRSIHALAFSPDGGVVLAAGKGTVARIDVATRKSDWIASGHHPDVLISRILVHSEPGFVVSCSHDGTARVWNLDSGKEIAVLRHAGGVSGGAFSPDGRSLFTHGSENLVWDTKSWARRKALSGGKGQVLKGSFSPDGRTIVAAGADGFIRIWDAESGEVLEAWSSNSERLLDLLLCEGGDEIISGGDDPACPIWRRSS